MVVTNIPVSDKDKEDTTIFLQRQIVGWREFLTKSKDPANRLFADNQIAVLKSKLKEIQNNVF